MKRSIPLQVDSDRSNDSSEGDFGAQSVEWLEGYMQSAAIDLGYDVYTQGAGFIQADGATT